jgi:hypothetical protein
LLATWITNDLVGYQTFPQWQLTHFGSTNAIEALPKADPDLDGDPNDLEHLARTDPLSSGDRSAPVRIQRQADGVEISYERISNRGFEVQVSTNPAIPNLWQPLNIRENAPFFSATRDSVQVPDTVTNAPAKFYRVRVFEP